jgi:class 3 adenylate cyclase
MMSLREEEAQQMVGAPTGTVTFLFTDIEGSTKMWERHPQAMQAALSRHDEILKEKPQRSMMATSSRQ